MEKRAKIRFYLAGDAVIVPISDEQYHENMQYFNDCIPVILDTLNKAGIRDTEENVRYWISDMTARSNMDICGDSWKTMLGYDISNYYASSIRKVVINSRKACSNVWDRAAVKKAVEICGLDEQMAYSVYTPLGIDVPVSKELQKILDEIKKMKSDAKAS